MRSRRALSSSPHRIALDGAILVLAVLRATRLITQDWLGEWWLVGPAKRWAVSNDVREGTAPPVGTDGMIDLHYGGWRSRLVSGLDCPHCVGFHLGWLALLGEVVLGRIPGVRYVWRFALTAFALSYVVGHVSARLDSPKEES